MSNEGALTLPGINQLTAVILALRRLKEEDYSKSEAILS